MNAFDLEGNERVLIVGAGRGGAVRRLMRRLPWGYVAGVDTSEAKVRFAKRRNRRFVRGGLVDLRVADGADLPWASARFDACIVLDQRAARLAEVRRVLKPDGQLLIATATPRSLWKKGFGSVRTVADGYVLARAA
jgi:SAM-dependent methyltransferase